MTETLNLFTELFLKNPINQFILVWINVQPSSQIHWSKIDSNFISIFNIFLFFSKSQCCNFSESLEKFDLIHYYWLILENEWSLVSQNPVNHHLQMVEHGLYWLLQTRYLFQIVKLFTMWFEFVWKKLGRFSPINCFSSQPLERCNSTGYSITKMTHHKVFSLKFNGRKHKLKHQCPWKVNNSLWLGKWKSKVSCNYF